jgi:hypothetical protein
MRCTMCCPPSILAAYDALIAQATAATQLSQPDSQQQHMRIPSAPAPATPAGTER